MGDPTPATLPCHASAALARAVATHTPSHVHISAVRRESLITREGGYGHMWRNGGLLRNHLVDIMALIGRCNAAKPVIHAFLR